MDIRRIESGKVCCRQDRSLRFLYRDEEIGVFPYKAYITAMGTATEGSTGTGLVFMVVITGRLFDAFVTAVVHAGAWHNRYQQYQQQQYVGQETHVHKYRECWHAKQPIQLLALETAKGEILDCIERCNMVFVDAFDLGKVLLKSLLQLLFGILFDLQTTAFLWSIF